MRVILCCWCIATLGFFTQNAVLRQLSWSPFPTFPTSDDRFIYSSTEQAISRNSFPQSSNAARTDDTAEDVSADFIVVVADGMVHAITSEGRIRWSKALNPSHWSPFYNLYSSVESPFLFPLIPEENTTGSSRSGSEHLFPFSNDSRRFVPGPDGQIYYKDDKDGVLLALPLHVRDVVFHSPFATPLFPSVYFLGKREALVETIDFRTGGLIKPESRHQLRIGQTRWVVKAMDVTTHEERWRFEWRELTPIVNFGETSTPAETEVESPYTEDWLEERSDRATAQQHGSAANRCFSTSLTADDDRKKSGQFMFSAGKSSKDEVCTVGDRTLVTRTSESLSSCNRISRAHSGKPDIILCAKDQGRLLMVLHEPAASVDTTFAPHATAQLFKFHFPAGISAVYALYPTNSKGPFPPLSLRSFIVPSETAIPPPMFSRRFALAGQDIVVPASADYLHLARHQKHFQDTNKRSKRLYGPVWRYRSCHTMCRVENVSVAAFEAVLKRPSSLQAPAAACCYRCLLDLALGFASRHCCCARDRSSVHESCRLLDEQCDNDKSLFPCFDEELETSIWAPVPANDNRVVLVSSHGCFKGPGSSSLRAWNENKQQLAFRKVFKPFQFSLPLKLLSYVVQDQRVAVALLALTLLLMTRYVAYLLVENRVPFCLRNTSVVAQLRHDLFWILNIVPSEERQPRHRAQRRHYPSLPVVLTRRHSFPTQRCSNGTHFYPQDVDDSFSDTELPSKDVRRVQKGSVVPRLAKGDAQHRLAAVTGSPDIVHPLQWQRIDGVGRRFETDFNSVPNYMENVFSNSLPRLRPRHFSDEYVAANSAVPSLEQATTDFPYALPLTPLNVTEYRQLELLRNREDAVGQPFVGYNASASACLPKAFPGVNVSHLEETGALLPSYHSLLEYTSLFPEEKPPENFATLYHLLAERYPSHKNLAYSINTASFDRRKRPRVEERQTVIPPETPSVSAYHADLARSPLTRRVCWSTGDGQETRGLHAVSESEMHYMTTGIYPTEYSQTATSPLFPPDPSLLHPDASRIAAVASPPAVPSRVGTLSPQVFSYFPKDSASDNVMQSSPHWAAVITTPIASPMPLTTVNTASETVEVSGVPPSFGTPVVQRTPQRPALLISSNEVSSAATTHAESVTLPPPPHAPGAFFNTILPHQLQSGRNADTNAEAGNVKPGRGGTPTDSPQAGTMVSHVEKNDASSAAAPVEGNENGVGIGKSGSTVLHSCIPPQSILAGFVDNGRFYRTFTDIELIGKGGFGSVYRVKHRFEHGSPEYAVKFVTLRLKASENISSRRYFREVSANRDLFSRQVVRYFTWWCEEPQFLPQDHCAATRRKPRKQPAALRFAKHGSAVIGKNASSTLSDPRCNAHRENYKRSVTSFFSSRTHAECTTGTCVSVSRSSGRSDSGTRVTSRGHRRHYNHQAITSKAVALGRRRREKSFRGSRQTRSGANARKIPCQSLYAHPDRQKLFLHPKDTNSTTMSLTRLYWSKRRSSRKEQQGDCTNNWMSLSSSSSSFLLSGDSRVSKVTSAPPSALRSAPPPAITSMRASSLITSEAWANCPTLRRNSQETREPFGQSLHQSLMLKTPLCGSKTKPGRATPGYGNAAFRRHSFRGLTRRATRVIFSDGQSAERRHTSGVSQISESRTQNCFTPPSRQKLASSLKRFPKPLPKTLPSSCRLSTSTGVAKPCGARFIGGERDEDDFIVFADTSSSCSARSPSVLKRENAQQPSLPKRIRIPRHNARPPFVSRLRDKVNLTGLSSLHYSIRYRRYNLRRSCRRRSSRRRLQHSRNQRPNERPEHDQRFPVTLLIQMELVSGMTLREWLDRKERTASVSEFIAKFHAQPPHSSQLANSGERTAQGRPPAFPVEVTLFRQLVKGLRDIHTHGIVHRDIKPENIFINDRPLTLKIGDFGLARFIEAKTITETQQLKNIVVPEELCSCLPSRKQEPSAQWLREKRHNTPFFSRAALEDIRRGDSVVSVKGLLIGTPGYTAPEGGALCTEKADVFSASLILLELLCPRFKTAMERYKTLENFRLRQKTPDHITTYLAPWAELMRRMGAANPRHRPSANMIYRSVKYRLTMISHNNPLPSYSAPDYTSIRTNGPLALPPAQEKFCAAGALSKGVEPQVLETNRSKKSAAMSEHDSQQSSSDDVSLSEQI